ncbi:MAG: hypothetical protein U5N86_11445 [Planctomycetota bacterium]|nr:hypothetical protein [Planctomycetota bacterium]
MAIDIVTNANFATTVRAATGNGQVYVLGIADQYGNDQSVRASLQAVKLFYEQYGLSNVAFGLGDSVDRTLLETDVTNVQTTPFYVFYVGDGISNAEYYRSCGSISVEQLKYFIEQKRA